MTSAEPLTSRPLPDLTSAGWKWRSSREEGKEGGGRGAPIPLESACQRRGEGRAAHLGRICFISLDRGDYVSIYNWPQSEWLKRGDRPPQARISHCPLRVHGVNVQRDLHAAPTVCLGLVPRTLGKGHKTLVRPRAERASVRLLSRKMSPDMRQGHERVGKGWSVPARS